MKRFFGFIVVLILLAGAAAALYYKSPKSRAWMQHKLGILSPAERSALAQKALEEAEAVQDPQKKIASLTHVMEAYPKESSVVFEAALVRYQVYTKQHPAPDTLLAYGEDLIKTSDKDDKPDVLNMLAYDLAEKRVFLDRAEAWAREALALSKDVDKESMANLKDTLGWVLYHAGKSEEASPFLDEAASVLRSDPGVLLHAGVVAANLGDSEKALNDFLRSMTVYGSNNVSAETFLNGLYIKMYGSTKGLDARLEKARAEAKHYAIFTARAYTGEAADWTLPARNGPAGSLADFAGKVLVMQVWGHW